MARKRDHKAEYAARKAKAKAAGYKSVREARATRKTLAIPRTRRTPRKAVAVRFNRVVDPIGTMRREAQAWSNAHSRSSRSEYTPDMPEDQLRKYHRAYVQKNPDNLSRRKAARDKRKRISEYVIEYTDIGESEWEGKYTIT